MSAMGSRQARQGSYAAVYTLVFVAIIAAANYLADRYNKTYDATESKQYSLSDQTHKILGGLDRDLKLYYFGRRLEFQRAQDLLVRYENASPRLSVEYVDVVKQPELTTAMNVRREDSILITSGEQREEAKSNTEQEITNSIIRLLKGTDKTTCFIAGHGEADPENSERAGFAGAKQEIEGANYKTETVRLVETLSIPESCTLVIVAGAQNDFLEPEIDVLRKYVDNGGRLLLLIDYQKTPGLVELAASWGVKVTNEVVIDLAPIGRLLGVGGPLVPLVSNYEAHPITEVMEGVASFFPMSRPVEPGDSVEGWTVSKLFGTGPNTFATPKLDVDDEGVLKRDENAERQGPLTLAVAATHDVPSSAASPEPSGEAGNGSAEEKPEDKKESRVVVVGTSVFAHNSFLGRGGNLDLLLNMLNWLTSDEDLISIRPKDPENTPLDLTGGQLSSLFWGSVVGLPLIIIFAGVWVWWERR